MLRLMAETPGEPVSRERFLDVVWGYTAFPTTRTVDNHIASLRSKLERDPDEPRWIKTVHGVGYKLEGFLQNHDNSADPLLSECQSKRYVMKTTLNSRTVLVSAALLFLATEGFSAATNDLTSVLQKGLFEEEANHNLNGAIQAYQSVIAQFDKDRKLAATAIFRLGECYRKQGKTNDALVQFQRVLSEFPDQTPLIAPSRQNLTLLGGAPASTASPALSDAARQEQKRLLAEELALVEKKARRTTKPSSGRCRLPGGTLGYATRVAPTKTTDCRSRSGPVAPVECRREWACRPAYFCRGG